MWQCQNTRKIYMSWFTANADSAQTEELKTGLNLASPKQRVEWAVSDGERFIVLMLMPEAEARSKTSVIRLPMFKFDAQSGAKLLQKDLPTQKGSGRGERSRLQLLLQICRYCIT